MVAYTCNSSPWLRKEDYEFEAYVKRQESKLMNCSGYVPVVVTVNLDEGNLQEKELISAHTAWGTMLCWEGMAAGAGDWLVTVHPHSGSRVNRKWGRLENPKAHL